MRNPAGLEIGPTAVQLAHMINSMLAPWVKRGVMLVALTLAGLGDTDVRRLACETERRQGTQPDPDLYCLTLIPTPDLLDASGTATKKHHKNRIAEGLRISR